MNIGIQESGGIYIIDYDGFKVKISKNNHYLLNIDEINKYFGTNLDESKNQTIEEILENRDAIKINSFKSFITTISKLVNEKDKGGRDIEEVKPKIHTTTILIQDISKNERIQILAAITRKLRIMSYILILIFIVIIVFVMSQFKFSIKT